MGDSMIYMRPLVSPPLTLRAKTHVDTTRRRMAVPEA